MSGFCTVALKLPFGLILRLPDRPEVELKGFSLPYGVAAPMSIAGGYALTPNVDADFFEEWMMVNENLDLVKKKFIFAAAKASDASSMAREMAETMSGLEPLDPDKPGKGLEPVGV